MQWMKRWLVAILICGVTAITAGNVLADNAFLNSPFDRPAAITGFPKLRNATMSATLNVSALVPDQNAVLAVVVDIAPGFHSQSHTPSKKDFIALELKPRPNPAIEWQTPVYPPGKTIESSVLGEQNIYEGRVVVYVPFHVKADAATGDRRLSLGITLQTCSSSNCYLPDSDITFAVPVRMVPAGTAITAVSPELFAGYHPEIPVASPAISPDTAIDFLGHRFVLPANSYLLAIGIALVVGIIFNLMPCVLPVLPLKAIGFFEVSRHNRLRCLQLGIVFSAGVIAIFFVLGMLIVLLRGFSWGQQFAYGWFVWPLVAILVAMAAGMFGLFDVALPQSVYAITPRHDTFSGNFLFGILTAILSTPCTAPMFAGLIAWSLKQPPSLGWIAITTVGVGMALPYLLLSAFPSLARWVPRSGPWSALLKQMMGFLVLAVAVYLAGGKLSSDKLFFWAVFAVIAIAMVFMLIRTIQLGGKPIAVATVGVLAVAVVLGSYLLVERFQSELIWQPYSPAAIATAQQTGKPVIVEFTANWCPNCLFIEAHVYHDRQVIAALHDRQVILIRADLSNDDREKWEVVNRLNPGGGIPVTAIYLPGQTVPVKFTSLYTADHLLGVLTGR